MTAPIKPPTQWRPPSGTGSVVTTGNLNLVTNAGATIVDNTTHHYPIATNRDYVAPKNPTVWTPTGS